MSARTGVMFAQLGIAAAGIALSIALPPAAAGTALLVAAGTNLAVSASMMLYDTLTAPDSVTEQPSIANVAVQDSSFGKVIPMLWGTMGNVAGNVIWATSKREVQSRESQSGKDGGPKQVTITKTYRMSFALGLCDTRLTGPMTGIKKIYRDLQLIYDSADAGPGAIATFEMADGGTGYNVGDIGGVAGGDLNANYRVDEVSGGAITALTLVSHGTGYAVQDDVALHRGSGLGNDAQITILSIVGDQYPAGVTFYPGTADQLPDPTIESDFTGVGAILSFTMANAGSGYVNGGTGGIAGGNFNADYTITSVNGSGGITGLTIGNPGTGYSVATNVNLHRNPNTSGNNAKIHITDVSDATAVPAYRYLCYVVFTDENLGRAGRTYNYTFELYQADQPTLTVVVPALCAAAGLTEDDIDSTALPAAPDIDDAVNMMLVSVQEVRAPLQQLAQAYRFCMVESGLKLHFRQLASGTVIAAIPESALEASDALPGGDGLVIRRPDTTDLPHELSLSYIDPARGYLTNTQQVHLAIHAGTPPQPRAVEVQSLALTAAFARQLAQQLLVEAWTQRETFQTTVSRAYAFLEPGDRVTITSRGLLYRLLVQEVTYGRPGLVELALRQDAGFSLVTPAPDPGIVPIVEAPVIFVGDSAAVFCNLPALTSSDAAPRYHVGYSGQPDDWPGAALFRSVDGEATYHQLDAAAIQLITGIVEESLDTADYHVIDDSTTCTVELTYGELASVSDLALYNGANLALIGEEIIGFGTAELLAERTYALSHLLRGRRGTEWAVDTHTAGERFVLLDTAVRPLAMSLADRHVSRPYKTVTFGQSLAAVEAIPFTPTAANLNGWSVAQPAAALDGADWVFTWRYRSRFAGDWVDGGGIGWDVDHAGFRVDIFTDGTYASIVRTTLTDGGSMIDPEAVMTWTYTTAMQGEDGGLVTTLYYRIYQLTNAGLSVAEALVGA